MIRTRKRRRQTSFTPSPKLIAVLMVVVVVVVLPVVLYMRDPDPEFEVRSLSAVNNNHNDTETTILQSPVISTHHQKSATQTAQQHPPSSPSLLRSQAKGFHSIHVYHGPDDAINSLPTNQVGITSNQQQQFQKGSQVDQDKIVAALASTHRPKAQHYFIDLAANDALQLSNTLLLEEKGWKGLCVEPNPVYWYRLAHRQCDIAAAFVGNQDMEQVTVSLSNKEYGGIVGQNMDNTNSEVSKQKLVTEQRYAISLKSLFDDFGVPTSIDYLSLDVEGAEELIMRDFPFEEYKIHFLTVERPKPKLQELLKAHQYQLVMMLVHWGETLWVHESVAKEMGMEKIQEIVRANSDYVDKKPQRGQFQFYIETGEYKRWMPGMG